MGAAIAGILAVWHTFTLIRRKNFKFGSSINFMLALYFGFGIVLLSYIQHNPDAAKTGIEMLLLGHITAMLISDVQTIAIVGGIILLVLVIFWKELYITAFDHDYAVAAGLPVRYLNILFYILLVGTVVIGLHTMGVILMGAMIIIPATAARCWTNSITAMLFLSAFFGAISGVTGSVASGFIVNLPTGPVVVLCASLIAFLSFFFAPYRGLLPVYLRKKNKQLRINENSVLGTLYMLSMLHKSNVHGHSQSIISSLFAIEDENDIQDVHCILTELETKDLAIETAPGYWCITHLGVNVVEQSTEHTFGIKGVAK
jgi:manganese/zinc/iron transport system permease protein